MFKKLLYPALLVSTIFLGEAYTFFHVPELRLRSWFLSHPMVKKMVEENINETNNIIMKQPVQVWQFVLSIGTTLVAIITGAMMLSSMYTNHEERLKHLEEFKTDIKSDIKEIKGSQEKILIILENKQDRK